MVRRIQTKNRCAGRTHHMIETQTLISRYPSPAAKWVFAAENGMQCCISLNG